MARPEKTLTDEQRAEVETLAAVLNAEQIADYFGIGRTTFFAIMERDPDVSERYKRGKAKAIGSIAKSLLTKAREGDTASMIFFLKTQAGWKETQAHEHTGKDGGPIKTESDGLNLLLAHLDAVSSRTVGGASE